MGPPSSIGRPQRATVYAPRAVCSHPSRTWGRERSGGALWALFWRASVAQQSTAVLYAPHPPKHGCVTRLRWLSRVSPTRCVTRDPYYDTLYSGRHHESTAYRGVLAHQASSQLWGLCFPLCEHISVCASRVGVREHYGVGRKLNVGSH